MADLKNTYITLKLGNGDGGSIDPSVLEGYATSGDMQSAFTLIAETQQVAAAGLNQLEARIDELSAATPSVDLSGYYTSAQTEDAISAATSGKADAANVQTYGNYRYFPKWNEQGIITDKIGSTVFETSFPINNEMPSITVLRTGWDMPLPHIYAPTTSGNPGDILVSTGNDAPVWSAVTFPDVSNYVTSAQVETQIDTKAAAYTPTSGFSTINGSAITNGGDITVANPDMSEYWTSAQTAYEIYTRTQDMVTSTDDYNIGWVSHIVKLTQADYDDLVNNDGVDDNTFYIIVNN